MALHLGENGCYGVMVHNTKNYTDEQLLKEFSKYGKVLELQKGGRNLVFAQYKEYEQARACLDMLQDHPDYIAKPARPRESRPIKKEQQDNKVHRRSRSVGRSETDKSSGDKYYRCKSMNRLENYKKELIKKQSPTDNDDSSDSSSNTIKNYEKKESPRNKTSNNKDGNKYEKAADRKIKEVRTGGGNVEEEGEREWEGGSPGSSSGGERLPVERFTKDVRFNLTKIKPKHELNQQMHRSRQHGNRLYRHSHHHHEQQNRNYHHQFKYSTCPFNNPEKPQSRFKMSMVNCLLGLKGPILINTVDYEDAEMIRRQGTRYLYDVVLMNFPIWYMMGDVYDLCSRYVKVCHVDMFYSHDPAHLPYAIIFVGSATQAKHLVRSLDGDFHMRKELVCALVADICDME